MKKDDNWQQLDSEALRGDSRPRLTQAGIVIGWLATIWFVIEHLGGHWIIEGLVTWVLKLLSLLLSIQNRLWDHY